MEHKIIKTEQEYRKTLGRLSALMDAEAGTPEGEELELLAFLIENYESEHFPISLPDPVDAIKFRMEQQGLTQKDLIPFIGSQGKVSEVLNRRRKLSLPMIRNLHEGLEIPAEVLIQKPGAKIPEKHYDRNEFPFNEMYNRGYFSGFSGTLAQAKQQAEECLEQLFSVFQGKRQSPVMCRNSEGAVDHNAVLAWQAMVLAKAREISADVFHPDGFGVEQIKKVIHLSRYTTGPLKARDYLAQLGIPLVTLSHLPRTYLDGACFLSPEGRPVIGMTLRHDRMDNFWFTLVHELAHIYLHLLKGDDSVFFDNTENTVDDCDGKEQQANQFCSDILIPPETWKIEKERLLKSADIGDIITLAEKLEICPAIIAGRIRHEKKDFSIHSNLVGSGEVKYLFEGDAR